MKDSEKTLYEYSQTVIAPVLFRYVCYILKTANLKGVKKLYFLARDGYVLKNIAEILLKKYNLDIECRYLYVSRYSLRTATYHLMDKETLEECIFSNSLKLTPKVIFDRCNFEQDDIDNIINEMNFDDINKPLTYKELIEFKDSLINNKLFCDILFAKSKKNYEIASQYLKQEKVFEDDFYIVDSGWIGSMQKSLSLLLKNNDYQGKIVGFYFGIYSHPDEKINGEYNSFYFSENKYTKNKVKFNNNLFEYMLSAPHGMTKSYGYNGDIIEAVMSESRSDYEVGLVKYQIDSIVEYINENNDIKNICDFDIDTERNKCFKILSRAMTKPTIDEVNLFSNFNFCDDSTESYFYSLTEKVSYKELNQRLIFVRIFNKLFKKIINIKNVKTYVWYYASLAYIPKSLQPFYRYNEYLCEYIRLRVK